VTAESDIVNAGDVTHGLGDCTSDMLRKRIKSIKTVYRTDLMKGIKSKKSAASPNDIYKQKLSWYMTADAFLKDATASKKITCSLVCLS
jgi:hypothetical protein